jgi:hypothetical protein
MLLGNCRIAVRRQSAWVVACLCLAAAGAPGCGSSITPEHTKAVAHMQELGGKVNLKRGGYEVDLRNTEVQDADLADLKHIVNLKNVDLRGSLITDAGLEHLRTITTLEFVNLERSNTTKEGIEKLRQALPNAEVTR